MTFGRVIAGNNFLLKSFVRQVYEDEVDLSDGSSPRVTTDPLSTSASVEEESVDASSVDDPLPAAAQHSPFNVGLLSAAKEINRLEDELHKVSADREHWRQLAKQELESALSQLQRTNVELRNQFEDRLKQLEDEKNALEASLVELDQQHQQELEKIISVRNELSKTKSSLTGENESLSSALSKCEEEKNNLIEQLNRLRKELEEKESDAEVSTVNCSLEALRPADREEPEGAPITNRELNSVQSREVSSSVSSNELELKASIYKLELLVEEKEKAIKYLENKLRQTENENEKLSFQLNERNESIDKLRAEVASLRESLLKEQKTVEQQSALIQSLEISLSQAQSLKSETAAADIELNNSSLQTHETDTCLANYIDAESVNGESRLLNLQSENEKLSSEVERLRKHLIEIEDGYTQEILLAVEREKQASEELNIAKRTIDNLNQQLKNNEELEKLKEKVNQITIERDKALNEASMLDDKLHRASASISNLQLVIEQIQKENEGKLQLQKKKYNEILAIENSKLDELRRKLKWHEEKHLETMKALEAASRLTEKIDEKEATIKTLKSEIAEKRAQILKLNDEISELKNSYEGKIDKQIIKSLILGYFHTPQEKKHEVERLLARVLDFNQEEAQRAGLQIGRDKTKFGSGNWAWLSTQGTAQQQQQQQQQSLSKLFVEFLENESKPVNPKLAVQELAKGLTDVAKATSVTRRASSTSTHSSENQLFSDSSSIANLSAVQPLTQVPTTKSE
ncbi:Thyroid receptor-interacting protein 11-like protein [Dinothrombium tinctorium]|uniref:Thyroid receptor-interacting protein 11-like protein n=1 Tax=Dinothrombium tinctorium TaxID=1965070 RepID=A0A3S3NRX0_9ACAR|nr:Thyroid receptor-interacting protein 11-like protein [Dinothrombium tinctorium]